MKASVDAKLLRAIEKHGADIDAIARLVKRFGGQRIYVPQKADDNHPLVLAGGRKAADALIAVAAGEHVEFPFGRDALTKRLLLASYEAGTGFAEAGRIAGVTRSWARRVYKDIREGKLKIGDLVAKPRRRGPPAQLDIEDFLGEQSPRRSGGGLSPHQIDLEEWLNKSTRR